ncbi:MAG: hypothetical protein HZA22_01290 [Nitrospirae bacterium]|nr:hypothetical protein [Nitrospirota bacterium]
MKRAGLFIAIVVLVMCAGGWAFGAGEKPKGFDGKSTIVPTSPASKEYVDGRLIEFYQNYSSDTLTKTGNQITWLLGIFGLVSVFFLFKAYTTNKEAQEVLKEVRKQSDDAHKELEEIYKVKESIYEQKEKTREYLDRARESMNKFVSDSKNSIDTLINKVESDSAKRIADLTMQGEEYLTNMRNDAMAELSNIRKEAQNAAGNAKASEENSERYSKAIEYMLEADRNRQSGDYYAAVISLDKAIELAPNMPGVYYIKAVYLFYLGDHSGSIDMFNKAAEIEPSNADALGNIGYVYIHNHDLNKAFEFIEKALKVNDKARYVIKHYALALMLRHNEGDKAEAETILKKLLAENDSDLAAAHAYAMLGEKGKLKDLLTKNSSFHRNFHKDIEFEPYRSDPEFLTIVGS